MFRQIISKCRYIAKIPTVRPMQALPMRRFAAITAFPEETAFAEEDEDAIYTETETESDIEKPTLQVPRNINAYQLAKLINRDPLELLAQVQDVTNDICTDEFQILTDEAIELVCLENELDIALIDSTKTSHQYRARAPIVTIMGHVDHGKTTLLDAFRTDFNKCNTEYGAITQTIGAFTVKVPGINLGENEDIGGSANEITFIDTPGHEAFQNMRSRGARVTDMIILVISAVESIQKQTIEVIRLAKLHHIPLIIAINKIDRPEADV